MNRAEQFTQNMKKAIDVLWANKPKNMAFYICVYARDIENRTEEQPDGEISIENTSVLTNYDKMWIRQAMDDFLLNE